MAQLISCTTISRNGIANARTMLFNCNRIEDIILSGTTDCQFMFNERNQRIRWIVDDTLATVEAAVDNYQGGRTFLASVLSKDGITYSKDVELKVDDVLYAFADPSDATHSYIMVDENVSGASKYLVNHTLSTVLARGNEAADVVVDDMLLGNGTELLPSLAFTSDPNTGLYRIAADNMGISTGGIKRIDVSNTANTFTLAATGQAIVIDAGTTDHTGTGSLISVNLDVVGVGISVMSATIDTTTTALTADTVRGCFFDINGMAADNDTSLYIGYDTLITAPSGSRADVCGYRAEIDSVRINADTDTGYFANFSGTMNHATADTYGVRVVSTGLTHTDGFFHGVYVNASTAAAAGTSYGVHVIMPASYGAATEAAFYASGNGNTIALLPGDGITLTMTEADSKAINIISDTANADNRLQTMVLNRATKGAITADRAYSNFANTITQDTNNSSAGDFDLTDTTTSGLLKLTFSHVAATTVGAKTDADLFRGTAILIDIDATTSNANTKLDATPRAIDITYNYTETTGVLRMGTTDIFRITATVPNGLSSAGAFVFNYLNLNADAVVVNDANMTGNLINCDASGLTWTAGTEFNLVKLTTPDDSTISAAINVTANTVATVSNLQDIFIVSQNASQTAAAAIVHDGYLINYGALLTANNTGATLTRQNPLINLALTNTATQAGDICAITDGFLAMSTTIGAGAGEERLYGNMVSLSLAGLNNQAQILRGFYTVIPATFTLNNGAAYFMGADVDMSAATHTNGVAIGYYTTLNNTITAGLEYGFYADVNSHAAATGFYAYAMNGSNTPTASSGLKIDKYVMLTAAAAANHANTNTAALINMASTNADDGGFDVTQSATGLGITYSLTNTATTAPTADAITGKAIDITVGASVQDNANSIITTMSARAIDVAYTLTKGATGTLNLEMTDIARIDLNIASGVAIGTAGGGNLNMLLLDGRGIIPGATVANTTVLSGVFVDYTDTAINDADMFLYGYKVILPYSNDNTTNSMNGGLYISTAANSNINNENRGIVVVESGGALAGATTSESMLIDYAATYTSNGANFTRQTNSLIRMAVTLTETANVLTMATGLLDLSTIVGAGTPTIYGTMVSLVVAGTNDQAQTLKCYYGNADGVILNNAAANFYGLHLDGSSLTNTLSAAAYGVYLDFPTCDNALKVVGSSQFDMVDSTLYYWGEDFDEEAAAVTLAAGLRADEWTRAGTGHADANLTYTQGFGGCLTMVTSGFDDNSECISHLNTAINISKNPIIEFRYQTDSVGASQNGVLVGLTETPSVLTINNIIAVSNDFILVGINSDLADPTHIRLFTDDNAGGLIINDLGAIQAASTWTTVRIDCTDTEQPRIWINVTGGAITPADEIDPALITGTIQDAIYMYPMAFVQTLDVTPTNATLILDYVKCWSAR